MQYTHRKLHRSVTEMRKSRSGRSSVSTGVPERCGRGAAPALPSLVGIPVPTDARPASPLGTVPRPGSIALVAITGSGCMPGMVRGDRGRVRGEDGSAPRRVVPERGADRTLAGRFFRHGIDWEGEPDRGARSEARA